MLGCPGCGSLITDKHEPSCKHALSYQGSLALVMRAMMALTEHFHRKGATVEIPRLREAKGDDPENLMIVGGSRILVRALQQNFTGPQDWPYHKGYIYVANTRAMVDRLGESLGAYASVSGNLKCAAVVRSKTREHWIDEGAYACPLEHVEWITLLNKEALGG